MPVIFSGAGALDPTGRNVVRAAAASGRHVEVWLLERRANCLEDHRGLRAGAASSSPDTAFDYYAGGRTLEGVRFAPAGAAATGWLRGQGLRQTLEDWRSVLVTLPDAVRRSKVLCGGHSLGGLITGQLAQWDFDGDRATTADRGSNLCAGYFVLDSRLEFAGAQAAAVLDQLGGLTRLLGGLPGLSGPGLTDIVNPGAAGLTHLHGLPLNPQVFASIAAIGAAAARAPTAESTIPAKLPRELNFDLAVRLFSARDAVGLALGLPDTRTLRATNEALFGFLLDDNTSPIGVLRTSLGTYDGGPVARKQFILPYGSPMAVLAFVGGRTVSPADPGALYRWRNYDATPDPGPGTVEAPNEPYTARVEEVSDIRQAVRAFGQPDADAIEWYFPLKLATDLIAANLLGDQSGPLAARVPGGVASHPALFLDAANGFAPQLGTPEAPGRDVTRIVLPGYDHVDVGTAAYRQADGRAERVSRALADFGTRIAPATAARPTAVCTSRRRFRIRVRPRRGVRSARVTIAGRRVRTVRRAGRVTAIVDLRGRPAGTVRVVTLAKVRRDGRTRTVRDVRRYRLCGAATR
jgi:hypothetical protein